MTKKYYETDDFKKLQSEWYKKINVKSDDENVTQPEVFQIEKKQYLGGDEYYSFCQELIREFKFKTPIHRILFELHAKGHTVREIEDWFNKSLEFKLNYIQNELGYDLSFIKTNKIYFIKSHNLSISFTVISRIINKIKNEYLNGGKTK